ncbi:MAG: hypothetical protein ACRES9_01170 [Gammaproteobacteria bacterium]
MNIATYGKTIFGAAVLGSAGLLGACVVSPPPNPPPPSYAIAAAPTNQACKSCGVIESIQAQRPRDYQLTITMDNGTTRTIDLTQQPAFQVGDRVQILIRTSRP